MATDIEICLADEAVAPQMPKSLFCRLWAEGRDAAEVDEAWPLIVEYVGQWLDQFDSAAFEANEIAGEWCKEMANEAGQND